MPGQRFYEARKYAYSLDQSHERFNEHHNALLYNVYSKDVDEEEFLAIVREAKIDLAKPDATSSHPHLILWWDVDLPDYVLIAKDGEGSHYWAFTRWQDEIMQRLAQAIREDARKLWPELA